MTKEILMAEAGHKIIKLFKNFYLNIKLSKLKYKRLGKCKACGNCCKSIKLKYDGEFIKTEEMFEKGKKCNKIFKMFFVYGKNPEGVLLFSCKHLGKDGKCQRYFWRPLKCWTYPDHDYDYMLRGGQTKKGCGFRYGSPVNFEEVKEIISEKQ